MLSASAPDFPSRLRRAGRHLPDLQGFSSQMVLVELEPLPNRGFKSHKGKHSSL